MEDQFVLDFVDVDDEIDEAIQRLLQESNLDERVEFSEYGIGDIRNELLDLAELDLDRRLSDYMNDKLRDKQQKIREEVENVLDLQGMWEDFCVNPESIRRDFESIYAHPLRVCDSFAVTVDVLVRFFKQSYVPQDSDAEAEFDRLYGKYESYYL